jgi:hypothetical protein
MLPMTLQFLIVIIDGAINDRLQRKLDHARAIGKVACRSRFGGMLNFYYRAAA